MRVLVTGASGFVGRWLSSALSAAGDEVVDSTSLDVNDSDAVADALTKLAPDAVAHLAAISFAPQAAKDPALAFATAVGGTINVLDAVRRMPRPAAVLVSGSSEVYGTPRPDDLPLSEDAPLRGRSPYALSKAAQESVALAFAAQWGLRVSVTRSFNHVGPGQRRVFVVPALTERILAAKNRGAHVPVGNLDVRRDLSDVRDVVGAYRLLLVGLLDGSVPAGGLVVNVCSGRSVAIRSVLEMLCELADVEPRLVVDRGLVRGEDPPDIRGDPARIERLIGWRATTPLRTTLGDVWAAASAQPVVAT